MLLIQYDKKRRTSFYLCCLWAELNEITDIDDCDDEEALAESVAPQEGQCPSLIYYRSLRIFNLYRFSQINTDILVTFSSVVYKVPLRGPLCGGGGGG